MTVGELKQKLDLLPDELIVCVSNGSKNQEVHELSLGKFWKANENKTIRVHAWEKDCVVIK